MRLGERAAWTEAGKQHLLFNSLFSKQSLQKRFLAQCHGCALIWMNQLLWFPCKSHLLREKNTRKLDSSLPMRQELRWASGWTTGFSLWTDTLKWQEQKEMSPVRVRDGDHIFPNSRSQGSLPDYICTQKEPLGDQKRGHHILVVISTYPQGPFTRILLGWELCAHIWEDPRDTPNMDSEPGKAKMTGQRKPE